jgi:UDP-N-acetylmuramyl pentapeptide phosphotransferase/UDP-N-acetylglucosamine-1-phosphate transferase
VLPLAFTIFAAFLTSLSVAALLVVTRRWHAHFSLDHAGSGPQKLHLGEIPRIGGIAIMSGFAASLLLTKVGPANGLSIDAPVWLIMALFVPFAAGLVEDVTKNFGPWIRLLATFVGAAIAYFFCGASILRFDVPPVDALLALHPAIAFAFTLFCVGGIAHAFNLSDGLNGLLAGLTLAATAGVVLVAQSTGDQFLLLAAIALASAVIGFGLLNFPKAYLFSGDGGAYLVGSAIAIFSILLCNRNPTVSPWLPFILVLYPFTDTTWAIVRRKLARLPIMSPDAKHLHSLLATRLATRCGTQGRSLASFAITCVSFAFIAVATLLYTQTGWLMALAVAYAMVYALAYFLLNRRRRSEVLASGQPIGD